MATREGSLDAPTRHPLDWQSTDFWSKESLEKELERVLLGFMRHEFDVFVCTTIVENGLDIPLANTIVIEHAVEIGNPGITDRAAKLLAVALRAD